MFFFKRPTQSLPSVRFLWSRVVFHDNGSVYIISTKGLQSMLVGKGPLDERYHLTGHYEGRLEGRDLASFPTEASAQFALRAVYRALGFRVARLARTAILVVVPILLTLAVISSIGTVMARASSPVANLVQARPETLDSMRDTLKAKLKTGASGDMADFVAPDYTFNPKIAAPEIDIPTLKCLTADAPPAAQKQ